MSDIFGDQFLSHFVSTVVYCVLGCALFAAAFRAIMMVTPFSIRKEIEEDQNTAFAIMIGSVFLGLGIIVAAAIHS